MDPTQVVSYLKALLEAIGRIEGLLWPLVHPDKVVATLLDDSLGLLLKVWFGFILRTTDFETGRDFTSNVTIHRFEPSRAAGGGRRAGAGRDLGGLPDHVGQRGSQPVLCARPAPEAVDGNDPHQLRAAPVPGRRPGEQRGMRRDPELRDHPGLEHLVG